MLFITDRGELYRGFGRRWPKLRWLTEQESWRVLATTRKRAASWGQLVTPARAEELFPGSTETEPPIETTRQLSVQELIQFRPELFDAYDFRDVEGTAEERAATATYHRSLLP